MNTVIYIFKDKHCNLIGFLSEIQSWHSIRNINVISYLTYYNIKRKPYDHLHGGRKRIS